MGQYQFETGLTLLFLYLKHWSLIGTADDLILLVKKQLKGSDGVEYLDDSP
jgi:hypothetical protein